MNSIRRPERILILEPDSSGHHGPTLQWMTAGMRRPGVEITVRTLPEAAQHPCFKAMAHSNTDKPGVKIVAAEAAAARRAEGYQATRHFIAREIAYWWLFHKWYRLECQVAPPDVVFLPYVDTCLYAIGLLGSPFGDCSWSGLAMRPSFHYRETGVIAPEPKLAFVKRRLFFRLLRESHLRTLLTIDEPLYEYVRAKRRYGTKVEFIREPAAFPQLPQQITARRHLKLAPDATLVLVYGAISARKGVRELITALGSAGFPLSANVLIAGRVSTEVHDLLHREEVARLVASGRLIVFDQFIEEEEEAMFFSAADIVWAGYRGHYASSGVLAQAAAAHKPLIACREGVLGWRTRRYHLGIVVNPADKAEVIAAVRCLLGGGWTGTATTEAGSWRPATFSEAGSIVAAATCGA